VRREQFEQHRPQCERCTEATTAGVLYRYRSGVRRILAAPVEAETIEMFWMGQCRLTYDTYARRFLPTPPAWAQHWRTFAAELEDAAAA